ncbi:MAG: alginate lyase family protein [Verrucomicrobia bacterium]|nr:alginate lyase family protein [Verrucomicrobiota bacterium]
MVCIWAAALADAHSISFSSTITYSSSQPATTGASIANWTGAAFDAANIGGSGVNADGGANNGAANDASTYVASNRPVQGQMFTTGSNANGYDLTGVTMRMAGYTSNTVTGSNLSGWNLNFTNGPLIVSMGKISGTTQSVISMQCFNTGGTGNPGSGSSANGSGTYLTFTLPFPVHLDPGTTYGFDFSVGNGNSNYFEWLGTSTAGVYSGGTAYTRSGNTITALTGQRVFMVNMTASAAAYAPFTHPGALHTQADFDRMKAKVAANEEPWISDYNILINSPWAQTGWPAYDVDYIVRGSSGNNYTRSQQDAQAIYELALRWKLTGNTSYADHAVAIANVWSGLLGVTGDTNQSLAAGICGYLFATGGEILSTYSGWAAVDKQAYKDMMVRVFYPSNFDFLWRHHDTFWRTGGNTHYRLNWDADNIASMAAIGILCDNKAIYQQALDFFKNGPGNGRVDRAAWYIHPDGTAQTEESGRDQAHNLGGWYSLALLCQMAWNQGDDLFGYDNNRVLRAFEYNAKYNLGNNVNWVFHRNSDLAYTETLSGAERGLGQYHSYELVYNHYANVMGVAAPYSKLAMNAVRPEPRPDPNIHPSQVDWLGLGSLTFARNDTTTGAAPSGLVAQWSKNQVVLTWWGTATATSYQIQRATSISGTYTTLGTAVEPGLNFTDTNVANGTSYYYKVVAVTPGGNLASNPLLVNQALVTRFTFEGNANDVVGTRNATAKGGTSAPGYTTGFGGGQAVSLNGSDQYVQLPVGSGNYRDITIGAWVYWNGGSAWQRVFDFGSEIEKYMMLTVKDGSGKLSFQMTTSRGTDGTLIITGPTMPTATWTHVTVTLNGDTATLYVNGLPVASAVGTMVTPLLAQPFCYLGKSMWTSDPNFSGRIDDFRIYNYTLTGKEVYALWGQGGANTAPAFTVNPINLPAATQDINYSTSSQTLASVATDTNGGTLTYAKVSGPSWLTVASNGALSGAPANADVGKNAFVVRVTDAAGASDDANLYITVNNVNDAPVWSSTSLTGLVVTRDQPYAAFTLTGLATDPDTSYGDTVAYSKIGGPAWLVVASNGALSGTPGVSDVGTNSFTVRVTDSAGAFVDATLAITVLPFTLRSQYLFEGNTTDSSGNFNGTAVGSPAYGAGRSGQAIVFDGSANYVTLPADVASYHDITVAGFVYWNGGSAWQRIFDFGNDTTQYLSLTPSTGSNMRFEIANGGVYQQIYAPVLATGRWVHVAVTLSGDTGTLYVDGVAVGTNTGMTINPDDFRPSVNYLGDSQYSADPLLNGKLDDFRIYNYALTASQVFDIANPIPEIPSGVTATGLQAKIALSWNVSQAAQSYTVKRGVASGGQYTAVASGITTTSYTDTGLTNGVTYYYVINATNAKGTTADSAEIAGTPSDLLLSLQFDETSGATAADSSGNGYNATLVNSPVFASGKLNNAINFASASSQYATLPNGVVSAVNDFTISTWVNPATFATWARVLDFGTGTTSYMFLSTQYTSTSPNGAKPRFAIRTVSAGEQGINSTIALTAGGWSHLAVTLSGNTATMYVNGAVAGTNTGFTLRPSSMGSTPLNYLGRSQWSADPYFNGGIDDFRIYSRALTAGEINSLVTPLPAPSNLAVTTATGQISLSWTSVANATRYIVQRASVSGGPYATVASGVTTTGYVDAGLASGYTYYYVVTAANAVTQGSPSAELSVLLAPPPPAGLTAVAGNGQVALTWAAATGATSYNVKRTTSSGGSYTVITSGAVTSYTDTGPTNGTTYYYVVSATNSAGESANSSEASATPLSVYQQWKLANGLSLATADTATPDNDGVPVLLKYATGLTPGTPSATGPATLTSANNTLVLQFNRLSPAPVDYTVEASPDLSTWTAIASLAAGADAWTGSAVVSETTGSPRAVTVTDTVTMAVNPRRFLRLRAGTGVRGTIPQGYVTLTMAGAATSALSVPLDDPPVSRGAVQGVTASTLTVGSAGSWATAAAPYGLRLLSGNAAGATFAITAVNGNALTLAVPAGVDLTQLVTAGDLYAVFPLDTLGTLFGTASVPFQTGATASSADTLQWWNGSAWLVFYHNGINWKQVGTPLNQNNTLLAPDSGFLGARRAASALTLTIVGRIHEVAPRQFTTPGGSVFLAGPHPVASSLSATGLRAATGWLTATTATSADTLQLWSGSAWLVFYHNGTNWKQVGSPLNQDAYSLVSGQPLFIFRKSTPAANQAFVIQPLPYTP